jgi:hypothetical protein
MALPVNGPVKDFQRSTRRSTRRNWNGNQRWVLTRAYKPFGRVKAIALSSQRLRIGVRRPGELSRL